MIMTTAVPEPQIENIHLCLPIRAAKYEGEPRLLADCKICGSFDFLGHFALWMSGQMMIDMTCHPMLAQLSYQTSR